MKFFGFFNSNIKESTVPDDFTKVAGIYANGNPLVFEAENRALILLGNVYHLPGHRIDPANMNATLKAILDHYISNGETGLTSIDGEYTLLLFNGQDIRIYRDFKGAGPQVFYNEHGFSNDLQLLMKVTGHSATPDNTALSFFLTLGYVPPEKSGINGIHRLRCGYLLKYGNLQTEVKKIIDPAYTIEKVDKKVSADELSDKYFRLHTQSIQNRISGKNKIGLLLSGGYDSGGNLAGIRDIYTGPLHSYTISFKDNPHSELEFVKIMAKEFNSELTNYEIHGPEIEFLPDIIRQTGIPFQESGLMINYLVMKTAGADCPDIVLGGDGNDQMFGTGAKELAIKLMMNRTGLVAGQKILEAACGSLESGNFFKRMNFYNHKIDKVVYPDRWGFPPSQLVYPTLEKEVIRIDPVYTWSYEKLYENRRINVDLAHTAFNIILFKASRMAELFDVQLTFPYLARPVFDFVNSLPVGLRIFGTTSDVRKGKGVAKYIHKRTYKGRMPQQITSRKKQGGFVPLSIFFQDQNRNRDFFDMIEKSALLGSLIKNKTQAVKTLRNAIHDKNIWFWYQQVYFSRLFNMVVLATWEKIYLENKQIDRI
jgi:asparagine synthase (glutamine-hydrolysing)